jgi:putative oxidoreductase
MQDVPMSPRSELLRRVPLDARSIATLLARWVIGAVFVAAALPKIVDPASFAVDIDNYRMLPERAAELLAVALPVAELVIAAALITGIHARGAAIAAAGMLSVFALGMAQAMARGIDLECGCFGSATETPVSALTILRNAAMIVVCVFVALARPASRT